MKKIYIFIKAALVFLVLNSMTVIYADCIFTDIKDTDWYYNDISVLANLKLVNGYEDGGFRPNSSIKANEFIKILLNVIGKTPSDLSGSTWDEAYIKMAEDLKLNDKNIIIYEDGIHCQNFTFNGLYYYNKKVEVSKQKIISNYNDEITREQVAAIIANVFALNNIQNYKDDMEEYIQFCKDGLRYYDIYQNEIDAGNYYKDVDLSKIFYNPLTLLENIIDDKKLKYSRYSGYIFFSNCDELYQYDSKISILGLNDIEYRNTMNYIPYKLKDFSKINDLYVYDVIDMYLLGIMQGDVNNYFNPKSSITRAEAVTVILRLMEEDRRLPLSLNDSKYILFYNINENVDDILYAPSIKGKPVNELVDLYEIINKEKDNTLGCEKVGASINSAYACGFETQKNLDDYLNFEISYDSNWLIFDQLNRLKNYDIRIDFDNVNNKYSPYEITINNFLNLVEDKEFEGIVIGETNDRIIVEYPKKFDEFFLKYHKDLFYSVYEYLFEDEVDVAWNLLLRALQQEERIDFERNIISIDKVINDRYVNIRFNDYYINITVSLKGNWK